MKKKILRLEHPRNHHMVGNGFRVAQYIPGYGREMSNETSPFLMLDYNAPWKIEAGGEKRGVGYHPHRGFETVTVVYSGEVEHRDTAGNGGTIGADEVQWMTAGSGLLHNEFMTDRFTLTGGTQHAAQLWVNLPKEHKMTTPRYQALTRENIPEVPFDGGRVRVIAGELHLSVSSSRMEGSETEGNVAIQVPETLDCFVPRNDSVKGAAETYSPVELYDVRFDSTGDVQFSLPEGYNAMVLIAEGSATVNDKLLENGDMVYLTQEGTEIRIEYKNPETEKSSVPSHSGQLLSKGAKVLIMAGKPLDEPVAAYGPFVMNTQSEIMQAFSDFRDGKMGVEP